MYYPLENRYLYGAVKLTIHFLDEYGSEKVGLGTGFMINHSGRAHIVTNRHLVEPGYSDSRKKAWKPKEMSFAGYGNSSAYFHFELLEFEILHASNNLEDVSSIRVYSAMPTQGIETFSGAVNFTSDVLADASYFGSMHVGDLVAIPGYPEWHDKNSGRPILRSGNIASDPTFDYTGPSQEVGARRLVYEGFSTEGVSGGPVFALGFGVNGINYRPPRIVGVNAGHFLQIGTGSHSALSYMFKSTVVLELLEGQSPMPDGPKAG